MDSARGIRAKSKMNMKDPNDNDDIGVNYNVNVIISMPDSLVLRVVLRSLFLAVFIVTLPFLGYILGASSDNSNVVDVHGFESFPEIFQDLAYEGLVKMGHKGLILSSGVGNPVENLQFLYNNDVELVVESELNDKSSVPDQAFDVVFSWSLEDNKKFIDRILRVGGIVVMQLRNVPSHEFQQDSNYKIVYLRRFDVTVVAMRKTEFMGQTHNSVMKRKLCGFIPQAKKEALKGLEDVWLEPPRRALAKSNKLRRKFRFLPDLLGDSLATYPHRIFITDEKRSVEWFKKNYPTRNQDFEIHNFDDMNYKRNQGKGLLRKGVPSTSGISDWMTKNVKEEDYVVMKAEAEMVEKMMNEKTISVVDELFLECKNQWQDGNKSKRAYWQCLALYGRLRDEGIAVHQWLN